MKKQLSFLMLLAALVVPWVANAQTSTATVPYSTGFEADDDVAWTLINNSTSTHAVWYIGAAAHNTGSKGLYVSNDGGTTNTYANSSTLNWAVRSFTLAAGQYAISFDWRCKGESSYDFLRCFLVPGDVTLSAGTALPSGVTSTNTPAGWLDLGGKMNLQETWQNTTAVFTIATAGTYQLAFMWRNDVSTANQPPAAVDNVQLVQLTCPQPDSLRVTGITTSSATFSWQAGGTETAWEIRINDGEWASATSPVTIDTFAANTPYVFGVRAVCTANETSFVTSTAFRTACEALTVADLPYTYGFEDATGSGAAYEIDQCWTRHYQGGSTRYPYPYNTYKHTGDYGLYFNNSTAILKTWATLPELDASVPVNSLSVGFWAYKTAANGGRLKIGVMTDPDNISTFTLVTQLQVSTASTWEYFEIPLSSYTGEGTYVAFLTDTNAANITCIDDVTLLVTPLCARPEAVVVSNITTDGATLTVTDPTNEGTYLLEVTGDTTYSETFYGLTYTFEDLQPNKDYNIAVAAVCSDNNPTASVLTTFHTPCTAIPATELPWQENFDSYTGGSSAAATCRMDIPCWRVTDRNSANTPYFYTTYNHSSPNSLNLSTSTTHPTVFSLPPFETPVSQLELVLWARVGTANYSAEVGYMSNPDDATTFVTVATVAPTATSTWQEFVIDFPAQAAGFIAVRKGNGTAIYLDDFTVRIAPSCARLQSFEVSNITATTADVEIADSTEVNNYIINAIQGTDTLHFQAYGSTITLTGLQPNTPYTLEVYTLCTDGTTPMPRYDQFRTECAVISQFPWTEDFESYDASTVPFCWVTVAGNNKVMGTASNVHSGARYLDFRGTTTGNIMLFPELAPNVTLSTLTLHFFTRPESTNAYCGYFNVGYYTEDENGDTVFVALDSLNVAGFQTATYRELDIPLTNVPNNSRLAFRHMANSASYYWYVDDVSLYVTPTCARAQGIGITQLSENSVDVIVYDSNHVGNYEVSLIQGHDTVLHSITDTVTTFAELLPNTEYQVYMVSNCGDGYTLPYTLTFHTPCTGIDSLPWTEDFNSYTGATSSSAAARMDLPCWSVPYRSSANYPYFNNSSTYVTSGNCVYNAANMVIVLPNFNYTPEELMLEVDVRITTANVGLEVGVVTNPDDRYSFTPVTTCIPDTVGGWRHFMVTFAGVTDGFLALRSTGVTYIDNLVVDALPACVPPSSIVVSGIDSVSATLTLADANNTNHYSIVIDDETIEIQDNTYQLQGLTPGTTYSIVGRTYCMNGELSEDSTVVTFTTMCGALPVPFFEDFNELPSSYNSNNHGVMNCWSLNKSHAGSYLQSYNSGTYLWDGISLKFKPGDAAARTILALPLFNQPLSTLELSFQTRPEGNNNSNSGSFDVGYMTDVTVDTTFVIVEHYNYSDFSNAYQMKVVRFPGAPEGARIAMRHNAASSSWFWFVDDVDVHVAPSCTAPQSVWVEVDSVAGVIVHVVDSNENNNYICYFDNDAVRDTVTITNDSVITVTTLQPSSNYTLRVVGLCSDGTTTTHVQTSFTTLCGAVGLPVSYDPNNYTAGTSAALPNCWTRTNNATVTTNYYPCIYSSSSNAHTGTNVLYYSFSTTAGYATKEIMAFPEIDTVNFPINQIDVSFWAKSGTRNRPIVVGVMTDPDSMSTFQPVDTVRLTTTVTKYIVEMGSFSGSGAYIALMSYKDTNAYSYVYVDDIKFEVGSPCGRSRNVQAMNATATTVDIAWTDVQDYYSQWKIRYTQDTLDTWTEVTANSNPFTLTGLTNSTVYRAVVAPVCLDGQTAFFSRDTVRFSTAQVPAAMPYSFDFDSLGEWQNWQAASNNIVSWYRGNIVAGDSSYAMYLSADSGATHSWRRAVTTNVAAYRDIDFGADTHSYSIKFRYIGGGHNTGNYDGISVLLVDPTTMVEIPNTYLGSPWGQIRTVHARHDSVWTNKEVLFDGVAGVKRLVFYHFNNAVSDSSLFTNIPPAIDDINVAVQACERPYDVTVDAVTPNTATIHWGGDDSATYCVNYYPVPWDSSMFDIYDTVVGTHYTINGLDANSNFGIIVRKLCTDTASRWTSQVTFTTLCGYENLPFSENFDSYTGTTYSTAGVLPDCWKGYSNGTSDVYQPHITGSGSYCYPHSGTNALTLTSGAAQYGDTKVVALPPFNAPMNSLKMSFWYKTESTTYGTLSVGYVTDLTDLAGSFVQVAAIPSTTTLTLDTVSFSNVPDNALQMAFRWVVSSTTNWNSGIDDINVWYEEAPLCADPVIVNTTAGETTATVNWEGDATSYQVAIMEGSWDESAAVPVTVNDTTKTFTGLTASTEYAIGVRSVCAANLISDWVTASVVTEAHPCYMPTDLQVETLALDGGTISWTVGEAGQSQFAVHVYNTTYDDTIIVSGETTLTLTGLHSDILYNIAVRAICGEDDSSNWTSSIEMVPSVCDAPTNLTATADGRVVTLNWQGEAERYRITYFDEFHTINDAQQVEVEGATTTTVTVPQGGRDYRFYVQAYCGTALSLYSNEAVVSILGIGQVDNTKLSLFPNPASTTVTLNGIEGNATVTLVDMNGRESGQWNVEGGKLTIDLSGYAKGAYFVRITGERTSDIRKLIVK